MKRGFLRSVLEFRGNNKMKRKLFIWVFVGGFVMAGAAVATGPEEGHQWTVNFSSGVKMEFIPIPAGTFLMGSNEFDDEKPVHTVRISKPFWLAQTEVTIAQWKCFVDLSGYMEGTDWKDRDCPLKQSDGLLSLKNNKFGTYWSQPMCEIEWSAMVEFCRWLTEFERQANRLPEGLEYTLPTEAQWEYACWAGTTNETARSLKDMGWYWLNSENKTHSVKMKQPNAWGLYDMSGNVWESCADWYSTMNVYSGGESADPLGPSLGTRRVSRGGCWRSSSEGCRQTFRTGWAPEYTGGYIGFRPAISAVGME